MARLWHAVALAAAVIGCARPGGCWRTRAIRTFAPRCGTSLPPWMVCRRAVVNYDDSIELRNRSGRTVVVEGYRGEPYVRIAADGTVAVNHRSPTFYLNDDRFAEGVEVPPRRDAQGHTGLAEVDRTGPLRLARPPHPLDGAHRCRRR